MGRALNPYHGGRWWRRMDQDSAGSTPDPFILCSTAATKPNRSLTIDHATIHIITGTGSLTLEFGDEFSQSLSPDPVPVLVQSGAGVIQLHPGSLIQGPLGYRLEVNKDSTLTTWEVIVAGWYSVEHKFDGTAGIPDATGAGQKPT